jgi:hypothetical protein
MTLDPELLSFCHVGALYRTRDRREARIARIDLGDKLIYGDVQMHGPCVWRENGRYRDAPFGAPGPLDLMPPSQDGSPATGPQSVSMKEALEENYRLFCCD